MINASKRLDALQGRVKDVYKAALLEHKQSIGAACEKQRQLGDER